MTPDEFWLLYDFKFPKPVNNVSRLKKILDLPEARPEGA